jgi:hypothetical protein
MLRNMSIKLSLLAALALLAGCAGTPAVHLNNSVIRTEVGVVNTPESTTESWAGNFKPMLDYFKTADVFLAKYRLTNITFLDPFNSRYTVGVVAYDKSMDLRRGDIVDVTQVPTVTTDFARNNYSHVLRIVCKKDDDICKNSEEGKKRGFLYALPQ